MDASEFDRILGELMYPEGLWVAGQAPVVAPVSQVAKGLLDRFDITEKVAPVDMEYAVVYGDDNAVYRGSIFANVYGALYTFNHYKLSEGYHIAERETGTSEWTIVS